MMENALLEVNTNFTEMDREHFFSLFMNIRNMYNLFRINDKSDTNAKMRAYDYVLNNFTDTLFFEEQLRHRNLTIKDCFLKY